MPSPTEVYVHPTATVDDGAEIVVNAAAEKVTGFKQSESLGKPLVEIFSLVNAKDERVIENPIQRVIFGQSSVNLSENLILIQKNNAKIPIEYNVSPIKSEQNQTVGFVLVVRDIAERKKLEEGIAYSEMKYRRVYETSQDGIIARNLQGRMIDCNQAYAKMLGYSKKELKDHPYTQVLPRNGMNTEKPLSKLFLKQGIQCFMNVNTSEKTAPSSPLP